MISDLRLSRRGVACAVSRLTPRARLHTGALPAGGFNSRRRSFTRRAQCTRIWICRVRAVLDCTGFSADCARAPRSEVPCEDTEERRAPRRPKGVISLSGAPAGAASR
eukprot:6107108-Prymnesium_polylepis.2